MIRGWKRRASILLVACFGALLLLRAYRDDGFSTPAYYGDAATHRAPPLAAAETVTQHPIDELIAEARLGFNKLLDKQSRTLEEAAARYRERRGRHPPPGFDHWFAAARRDNAIVVEEFFDRIHHDINPLWALKPRDMREQTHNQPFLIRVRNGEVHPDVESPEVPYRVEQWARLVDEMRPHIPDLDLFVNVMDEPRILVPWETVDEYVAEEQRRRAIIPAGDALSEYGGYGDVDNVTDTYDPSWIPGPTSEFWDHVSVACPPDTPARSVKSLKSFDGPVDFPSGPAPAYTYKGYVRNFTASQDSCVQAHLRGMHGTYVDSISMSTSHELLPLFAESKLPQNNELLIPGAVYLDDSWTKYSGGRAHGGSWAGKKDALVWRGSASGARNKRNNWWHIHRNRFVQMLNATTVAAFEAGDTKQAPTFQLPPAELYNLPGQKEGRLSQWLSTFADAGYIDILCDPQEFFHHWWHGKQHSLTCSWLTPWFSLADRLSMKQQYEYKYLPDVDGNSFSGRYRAFLLSSSVPLKSTIYAEWHDDRLFPWVHFVPFDNSYIDIYGIMDYFLDGHDAQAEAIAMMGKIWAESVLRRADMRLYVWRLLLEYARVVDDNRDRLAFVDDWK